MNTDAREIVIHYSAQFGKMEYRSIYDALEHLGRRIGARVMAVLRPRTGQYDVIGHSSEGTTIVRIRPHTFTLDRLPMLRNASASIALHDGDIA